MPAVASRTIPSYKALKYRWLGAHSVASNPGTSTVPPESSDKPMNEDPPSGGGAGKSPYGPGVEWLEEFQRSLAAADIALVVAWLKGPMLIRFKTTGLTALIED